MQPAPPPLMPDPVMAEAAEATKRKLFRAAMQGQWDMVIAIYTDSSYVQAEKITRSEDTVLHVAVSDGKKDVVKRLVDAVAPHDAHRILEQQNEKGNTPLHLAAALGMVEVCAAMAKKCPLLAVEARNKKGETPLFLAAKYGKKYAFFALQDAIESTPGIYNPKDISYCRRQDGNTILHVAISAEHFELALEIIYLYERLVNFNNERGETALHCLANKPDVFKSGSRFDLLDNLIYSCTFVTPMTVKYAKFKGKIHTDGLELKDGSEKLPENYKTCVDAFILLRRIFRILFSSFKHRSAKNCYIADEEDPDEHVEQSGLRSQGDRQSDQPNQESTYDASNQLVNGSSDRRFFPENYDTCSNLFQLFMKVLLVVLGIGLWRTQEIHKKKRKHVYACQIMDELVTRSLNWEYDKDGKKPEKTSYMASAVSLPRDTPPDDELGNSPEFNHINSSMRGAQHSTMSRDPNPNAASIMVAAKSSGNEMLKKLLDNFSLAVQQDMFDPKNIVILGMDKAEAGSPKEPDGVTPILVAAKRGVTEMVEKILDNFPVAVQDVDSNDKNIILLAVEHRQPNVYQLMLKQHVMRESVFGRADKDGNSALHLAATLGQTRPWIIPGAALQMQWEIKWFKFVLRSMDPGFFPQYNNTGQTAREIFTEKHEQLAKDGGTWLSNTSQSCSVVAALIATVAFASATTVPGGVNDQSGIPILEAKPAFQIFALSALIALCFSVTSLIMFLSILTSRYQERDFENDLPVKLILGLTSLFMSIATMLVSFCAGHFFVVEKKLKYVTFPIYAVMCLPVSFFAVAQFPLYVDLLKATFARVPERTVKLQAF